MMFQEAKTMFKRDDNIDVIKFNLVTSGSFQDINDLEELLNTIVLFYHDDYHDGVDVQTCSAPSFSSQKSKDINRRYFSDNILQAVEMLIDDASYGIFEPKAHGNSLIELLKFVKKKAELFARYSSKQNCCTLVAVLDRLQEKARLAHAAKQTTITI